MAATLPLFIAIGASGAEGLDDIRSMLSLFQKPVQAIVMVVLHRPSDRISYLQEVLARCCEMSVVVADQAAIMESGVCYIGQLAGHLTLLGNRLAHLVPACGNRFRGKTIDLLFESLAKHAGTRTTAVVLSGALADGSRGLAAIHAAGGLTMVLSPGIKPRGMQQNAIDYDGPISLVGTAEEIAAAISQQSLG